MSGQVRIPMTAVLEFAGYLASAGDQLQGDGSFGTDVSGAILMPWQHGSMLVASDSFRGQWQINHRNLVASLGELLRSVETVFENWAVIDQSLGTDFSTAVQLSVERAVAEAKTAGAGQADVDGVRDRRSYAVDDTGDEQFNPRPMPEHEELVRIYGERPGRLEGPHGHVPAYTDREYQEMWAADEAARRERVLGIEDDRTLGEKANDRLIDPVLDFFGRIF